MQEQSNKQFYISDWHYGHANVIAFDNRPFKSLLEMDEALVDRWNAVVSPGDIVYVLGDMFWCKAQDAIPILRSLKGQKFLIKGNHDRCNDNKFLREFVKVTTQFRALRITFTVPSTCMDTSTILSSGT